MTKPLVFLIDTNVFIAAEPTACDQVEALVQPIAELERLVRETRNDLVVHPEMFRDIRRDRDAARKSLRLTLADKYPRLKNPPTPSESIEAVLGRVEQSTHDWIDHSLLASLSSGLADFLVTEDDRVHAKGARLGLADRILKVVDALEMVRRLYESVPPPPPAVQKVGGRALDLRDPIFDSLRCDYPNFDSWFPKVRLENRAAWIVAGEGEGYAALCIVKAELPGTLGLFGSVLKVCTFKVSELHEGNRLGELLLKALFDYARANHYDWLYLTVFPDKAVLVRMLEDFGFEQITDDHAGQELVLAKHLAFSSADFNELDPYAFHVKFGPPAAKWQDTPAYIVPIRPEYHHRLFPEADSQTSLFPGREAQGNAIRKAYLSRSSISSLQRGDLLYFYESQRGLGVTTAGVVEEVNFSSDCREIIRIVGKRTLYTYDEIAEMAPGDGTRVLVILFRQATVLAKSLSLRDLVRNSVVSAAPQSIQRIRSGGAAWIGSQVFQ